MQSSEATNVCLLVLHSIAMVSNFYASVLWQLRGNTIDLRLLSSVSGALVDLEIT